MIAKCIVVLAIVAQINANLCSSRCGTPVFVTRGGSGSVSGVATGVATGTSTPSGSTRNLVAGGKYPVVLQNTGPVVDKRVPVSTSHVQAPVQVRPTVRLPTVVPSQKTVAHTCTCYKTVVRPTVQEQYITVPTVQRYIETSHRPVVENIHYEAVPVNCPDTMALNGGVGVGSLGGVGSFGGVGSVGGGVSSVRVAAPVVTRVQTVTPVVSRVQTVTPVQYSVPMTSFSSGQSCQSCY